MTHEHSDEQHAELSIEIRKLEIRLTEFLEHEDDFIAKLRNFLERMKSLNEKVNNAETSPDAEKIKELMKLKLEITDAFSETLRKASKAEHERSHLIESYGALITSMEHEFQELCSRVLDQR
ncbi:MAG: hypothetical protein NWE94_00950 [Candidatus Bathyarchaeota archaeon]|nr:hypothetical protein [Candidatus Bathyarchaeota archaeon]